MDTHKVIVRCNASGTKAVVELDLSAEEVKLLNLLGDRIRVESDWDLDVLAIATGTCDTVPSSTKIPQGRTGNSEHDGMYPRGSADKGQ